MDFWEFDCKQCEIAAIREDDHYTLCPKCQRPMDLLRKLNPMEDIVLARLLWEEML